MKKAILFLFTVLSVNIFAQAFESFNFTGSANANGWTTHSGTPGQLQADALGSLTYSGLASSTGNKINLIAGNSEDINKAVSITADSAFYSFLVRVNSSSGLQLNSSATGDNFFGFGATAGSALTAFGSQLRIRSGVATNSFQIALVNVGAASLVPTSFSADLNIGTTYFLVVRMKRATSPIQSTLWINPIPGTLAPPTSSMVSTQGTGTFVSFSSIYIRQAGNASAGTGNVDVDEIRVGSTWASVTPGTTSSCVSYSTVSATACNSYSLNNQTYTTSGTYVQTLPNANSVGCDSVININLTINNSSSSTLNITNCGPFTLNNQTYSTSGTYTQLAQNVAGCDSTINLILTITTPPTYYQDLDNDGFGNLAVSQTSCVAIPGYVTNNTDCNDNNNAVFPGAFDIPANNIDEDCNGFDAPSCVTYNIITISACNTYTLNNQTYTTSGNYFQTLANANAAGCDSIINLQLTVNISTSSVLNFTECSPLILNNQTYNVSGVYTQTLQNAVGCDSIITINLTIINPITVYQDLDNDGYGNAAVSQSVCSALTGYVANNSDCDDNNNSVYPGATEIAGNGIDEDCSGTDLPTPASQLGIYEFTQPAGCPVIANMVTIQPSNASFSIYTNVGGGCTAAANVFNNNTWNTGAIVNPNNYNEFAIAPDECYGLTLTQITFTHKVSNVNTIPTWHLRSSLDNFSNDIAWDTITTNAIINDTITLGSAFQNVDEVTFRFYITGISTSGATWRNDNVSVFGFIHPLQQQTFFADFDNDGFGDFANDSLSCSAPAGYVSNSTDCNDNDALVNPNTIWYQDLDNDQVGNTSVSQVSCTQPAGYVLTDGDCNDNDASITAPTMYYSDNDQDGFGDDATGTLFCQTPVNLIPIGGDCDDNNNAINPNATEICDGFDNNCNGQEDEGLIFVNYYFDGDSDGFGIGNPTVSCSPIAGYATQTGDCDDGNNSVNPGATDTEGNGIDENCDGIDGVVAVTELQFESTIAPNPSSGLFEVQLNTAIHLDVLVLDLNGKVQATFTVNSKTIHLDLTQLNPGTYFLNLVSDSHQTTHRLVKL